MSNLPQNFGLPVPGLVNLTATGTTQATAFPITAQYNVFSSVPSATGALLPTPCGGEITVYNQDVLALALYPAPGDQIYGSAVNASITVLPGQSVTIVSFDNALSPLPRLWRQSATSGGGAQSGSVVVSAATVNRSLGSLPPGSYILRLLCRETAGHAVNLSVGTAVGLSDVLAPQLISASGALMVPGEDFLVSWFSATLPQSLFLTSANWNSASLNVSLIYQVGP